jgi:hypothetical protein
LPDINNCPAEKPAEERPAQDGRPIVGEAVTNRMKYPTNKGRAIVDAPAPNGRSRAEAVDKSDQRSGADGEQ